MPTPSPMNQVKKQYWDHVASIDIETLILGQRQRLAVEAILIDRADAAIDAGRLTLDEQSLTDLFRLLFPQHHGKPKRLLRSE